MMFARKTLLVITPLFLLCACTRHEIESRNEVQIAPVEIKPIHITIDINIKVDRALDNFFDDIDKAQP
ncbi:MAG: YnbE family lipoprotein [Desulfobulbaceae bacterium]|nr:YnbE family lipoprotein [Desulfobulbaceae bacterium]